MEELRGTTVLITGASRGLGAALSHAFARAGARLSLCARHADGLREVEEELRAAGTACLARAVDVAREGEVAAWVEETARALGPPRVLINNASLLGPRLPLAEHPLPEWRQTLEVNLTGTLVVSQAVLPHMRAARDGCIVNVSSGAALPPRPRWGAYAVSKAAVEALSFNLAEELEGTGVRVNVVDPGAMRTRMRAAAYPEEDPARLKEPDAATPVFLWLASGAAREVTGQRFHAGQWRAGEGNASGRTA